MGQLRADADLLARLSADPTTRIFPISAGQGPIIDAADGPVLLLAAAAECPELGSPGSQLLFLGMDDDKRGYLALALKDPPELPEGARWSGLREVGAQLDDAGAGIFTVAVALLAWHANHSHCARCGTVTNVVQAGWVRLCPNCGAEHYPRTDPAVIMAVVDPDDRILLGHQATWPALRFSTLAGFVEPGEALEDAVRREVHEESGIVIGPVTYRGSQPWPFPSSLMLGFRAQALSTKITVDEEEIAQARWWTRAELADDVRSGRLLLPPRVSIARRLIEEWFGGPIQTGTEGWG